MEKIVSRKTLALRIIGVASIVAVTLAGCATTPTPTEGELQARVERATTPADHLDLAAYFEKRAIQAEGERDKWRDLRKHYEHTPPSVFYPIGTVPGMLSHYDMLIQAAESDAQQFRALAHLHRGIADSVAAHGKAQ